MLKYTILVLLAVSVMAESSFKARINNDQDIQTTITAPKGSDRTLMIMNEFN